MTPAGIEQATFRFVPQHLSHCATAVPIQIIYYQSINLATCFGSLSHYQVNSQTILKVQSVDVHIVESQTFTNLMTIKVTNDYLVASIIKLIQYVVIKVFTSIYSAISESPDTTTLSAISESPDTPTLSAISESPDTTTLSAISETPDTTTLSAISESPDTPTLCTLKNVHLIATKTHHCLIIGNLLKS